MAWAMMIDASLILDLKRPRGSLIRISTPVVIHTEISIYKVIARVSDRKRLVMTIK